MREDEVYLEIAERFVTSCEQHLANGINIQEVIGFKCYHAFESLAGAYNSHFGLRIPRGHTKKINLFVTSVRGTPQAHAIAAIAILLASQRNMYLYPEPNGSVFRSPKDQITISQAKLTLSRVKGVLRAVKRVI